MHKKYLSILFVFMLMSVSLASEFLKKGDRIIFFGDSITKGGVTSKGYITLANKGIQDTHSDLKIQLIGAGISGNKVDDLQKRVAKDVLAKQPDWVMIYIGINDVWHWSHAKASGQGRKGTTPEAYEAGLKTLIKQITATKAQVLLCTPTVIGEKHDGSNSDDEKLEQYSNIVRKVAKETNTKLLDLRKGFIDYLKVNNPNNHSKGILTRDRVHLNDKGNQLVANLVLESFGVPKKSAAFFTPKRDRKKTNKNGKYIEGRANVLIIGDSISIGYTPTVISKLEDTANIFRIPTNGGHTKRGLEQIDEWLGDRKWDIIHFNWGLHDLCYRNPKSKTSGRRDKQNGTQDVPIDQYAINLEKLVTRLSQTKAKLIWASTTLVPEKEAGRRVGDELKYNAIAKKIMEKNEITINDLHTFSTTITQHFSGSGDVHFKGKGSKLLGEQVTQSIQAYLPKN